MSRTWVDGDVTKPLSAARMNGIEADITANATAAAAAQTLAALALPATSLPATMTPTNASVTKGKLSATGGTAGQVLVTDGTILQWVSPSTTGILDGAVTKPKLSATGGTNGQVLSTDGTVLTWVTPASSAPADGSVTKPKLSALGGTAGQVLSTDGTVLSWITMAAALADAAVTKAKLSATGGTSGQLLGTDGSILQWVSPGGITPTGIKTANYTAAAGEFVPVDTTSGPVTITLPAAPVDGAMVDVKLIAGTNPVTVTRGGTATFDIAGGPTSLTLSTVGVGVLVRFAFGISVWYARNYFPLSAVGASFAPSVPAGGGAYVSTLSPLFQTVPRLLLVSSTNLGLTCLGAAVDCNAPANISLNLLPSSSVPWLDNGIMSLANLSASSVVTVVPGTGVAFLPADGRLKLASAGATGSLRYLPGGSAPLPTVGLLANYDADSIAGTNGSAVSVWPETSGNGHPAAAQATSGNQPSLLTNSLNGHNVVSFDGISRFLTLSGSMLALSQNRGQLLIMVAYVYPTGVTGVRTLFALSSGSSAGSTRAAVFQRDSGGMRGGGGRRLDADTGQFFSGTASTAGAAEQVGAFFDWTNSDFTLYQNGTLGVTNTNFQTAGPTSNTASLAGTIGSNLAGAAEFFAGRIAQILVYSVGDAATRAQVDTYWQAKYGIAASDASAVTDLWFKEGGGWSL